MEASLMAKLFGKFQTFGFPGSENFRKFGRIKLKHIVLLAKLLPDNELISRQHTETLNTYDL